MMMCTERKNVGWLGAVGLVISIGVLSASVIPSVADMQSSVNISANGTVYWVQASDGNGGNLRVTTAALGASTGGLSVNAASTQNGTVTASGTVNPLFLPLTSVKRTDILSGCTFPVAFTATGAGSLTVGGVTINGFSGAPVPGGTTFVTINTATNGGVSPGIAAAQQGTNQYGFGTSSPTTSIAKLAAAPVDGFTLAGAGQCVVYVANSSSLLTPGTTVSGGGAGGGFKLDGLNTVQAASAKQDTTSISLTVTTTIPTTIPRVPTVGNWGMMVLGLAFLGAMTWMLKARRVHLQ